MRVGTPALSFTSGNNWPKASRNCSSRDAASRIAGSGALPIRKKFADLALVQFSAAFADALAPIHENTPKTSTAIDRRKLTNNYSGKLPSQIPVSFRSRWPYSLISPFCRSPTTAGQFSRIFSFRCGKKRKGRYVSSCKTVQ